MNPSLGAFALVLEKAFSAFCSRRLQEIGVTQGQLYFLLYIGKHPGCAPGELTRALHLDWGHAQRSLDKLAQDGFVRREKNPQDRRAYRLWLTQRGETAFAVSHQVFYDWDAAVLQALSPEEQRQLFALLERVAHGTGGPAGMP